MELIIGGAYQGKTDIALKRYDLSENDIECCSENELPRFDKKVITHIELFSLYCVKNELEPTRELEKRISKLKDCVIIADDIFCGVVPIDKTLRTWREASGRMMSFIAQNAERVTRVFCGIEQALKG